MAAQLQLTQSSCPNLLPWRGVWRRRRNRQSGTAKHGTKHGATVQRMRDTGSVATNQSALRSAGSAASTDGSGGARQRSAPSVALARARARAQRRQSARQRSDSAAAALRAGRRRWRNKTVKIPAQQRSSSSSSSNRPYASSSSQQPSGGSSAQQRQRWQRPAAAIDNLLPWRWRQPGGGLDTGWRQQSISCR